MIKALASFLVTVAALAVFGVWIYAAVVYPFWRPLIIAGPVVGLVFGLIWMGVHDNMFGNGY